jgi:hypothetical protein
MESAILLLLNVLKRIECLIIGCCKYIDDLQGKLHAQYAKEIKCI